MTSPPPKTDSHVNINKTVITVANDKNASPDHPVLYWAYIKYCSMDQGEEDNRLCPSEASQGGT